MFVYENVLLALCRLLKLNQTKTALEFVVLVEALLVFLQILLCVEELGAESTRNTLILLHVYYTVMVVKFRK